MWLGFLTPTLPLSSYLQWNFQMAFVVQVQSQTYQDLNLKFGYREAAWVGFQGLVIF